MNLIQKSLLTAAAVASVASVSAVPINGVVTFAGAALLNNANSALATQVSVLAPTVVGVSGDLAGPIAVGNVPAITSPLVLGATPATIWSVGGFTFVPTAPLTGGGGPNNTFAIGTIGIVDDGPGGWDPTPAIFSMATTPTIGGLGAFGSITAVSGNNDVPDTASSLALLGLGLVALGIRRQGWI